MNEDSRIKEFKRNLDKFRNWLAVNAVQRAVEMVLPSFYDGNSRTLQVIVDDELSPRTDGKRVWVSLIPDALRDMYPENIWKMLIFVALCHEIQHNNSSNFEDIQEIGTWFAGYAKDKNLSIPEESAKEIAANMLNIVEDGRIESIAVVRWPGMTAGFRLLNEIIREGTAIEAVAETPDKEFSDFSENILSYAKTGLFSPGIKAYAGTELEKQFLKIQHHIDEGVAARTSRLCREAVQKLLTDSAEYIASLVQQSENLQQMASGTPEYTENQETMPNNSSGSGNPLRNTPQVLQAAKDSTGGEGKSLENAKGESPDNIQKDKDEGKQESSEASANASGTSGADGAPQNASNSNSPDGGKPNDSNDVQAGFCDSDVETKPLTEEELEELAQIATQAFANANAEAAEANRAVNDGLKEQALQKIRDAYNGRTLEINQEAVIIRGNSPLPADLKAEAIKFRRELERILVAKRRSQRGLRSGTLDTNVLWKVGVSDDTIFARRRNPQAGSCAFYLLIDNSGSTQESAYETTGGPIAKYQAERRAAAVIEDAASGLVPCKIALFNQSLGKVHHQIIRTFDETKPKNRSWNSLMTVSPGGCNADSVHIRIAAEELMRRSEQKKVLFILSDGLPSAYGSKEHGESEVNAAVREARRKGIIVIPIMFGEMEHLKRNYQQYVKMYTKDVIACVPQEILAKLTNLFRMLVAR